MYDVYRLCKALHNHTPNDTALAAFIRWLETDPTRSDLLEAPDRRAQMKGYIKALEPLLQQGENKIWMCEVILREIEIEEEDTDSD